MNKSIITDVVKLTLEYFSGLSAKELATRYGTSTTVITNTLKKAGATLRNNSENAKIRLAKYGHPNLGKKFSEETKAKMSENHADISGRNNPNYKHGKRVTNQN